MKPLRILIVDDNRDLSDSLGILLEEQGYLVTVVYSGEEAVDRAREEAIDLAIIDLKLPGINGAEVLRAMRRLQPGCQNMIMTGFHVDRLLTEATEDGAVCVLHKPFPMEKLFTQLAEIQQN
ncbi:MAG: response regulator [Gammaproteobacteria bacterium]